MLLNVHQLSNSPTIVSLGDHDHGTNLKLENVGHLPGGKVKLDRVIRGNIRVGVTEGTPIVCHSNRNLVLSKVSTLDLTQLVLPLSLVNPMQDKPSLGIKQQPEAIVRLL